MEKEIDELRKKCIELRKKIKESVSFLTEYAYLCSDESLEGVLDECDSEDNVDKNKEESDNEGSREL